MEEKKQIGFALQHIETTQFAILEDTVQAKEEVNLESGLNFQTIPFDRNTLSI